MTYEFITPSDPITFKTENEKVAFFCALILGNGKAGMTREDGEKCESPMLFLRSNAFEKAEKYLGCQLAEFDKNHLPEIVDCFRSFAYGGFSNRKAFDSAVSTIKNTKVLAAFKAAHEEKERSSMNRWVKKAWAYADAYEVLMNEKVSEPVL